MYTHLISKPYKKGKQKKTKEIRIVSTENYDNFLWTLVLPDNERVDSKNMISQSQNFRKCSSSVFLFTFLQVVHLWMMCCNKKFKIKYQEFQALNLQKVIHICSCSALFRKMKWNFYDGSNFNINIKIYCMPNFCI